MKVFEQRARSPSLGSIELIQFREEPWRCPAPLPQSTHLSSVQTPESPQASQERGSSGDVFLLQKCHIEIGVAVLWDLPRQSQVWVFPCWGFLSREAEGETPASLWS